MLEVITRALCFKGRPEIPGDKSISHRALIFGALAEGKTQITHLLESADVQSTAACLKQMGIEINHRNERTEVIGKGAQPWTPLFRDLDCGNSGTTMRLLMGVVAGKQLHATLTGDASLTRRPMRRVADPLQQMGARIILSRGDFAPLSVLGRPLQAIDYSLPVASAQIKTSLILAALHAEGTTVLRGEIQSRDHTERMLKDFGVFMECGPREIRVPGKQKLTACSVQVPGDPSTAAFWIGAATLIPGADLRLDRISLNPTRNGFVRVLERMGAKIESRLVSDQSEPIGEIRVRSGQLFGTRISPDEVPFLVDELPVLAILATQAHGVTVVEGAEELRVKESDRLEAVISNLQAMGVHLEARPDGFRIEGPQQLKGCRIKSNSDHRIAMAFSIAGLVASGSTEIEDAECVAISYPDFFRTLRELTSKSAEVE